jgi:dTDP-4-dehydro-6-deoxy-alpha-D-glucopyranose 2,3-dehydratase
MITTPAHNFDNRWVENKFQSLTQFLEAYKQLNDATPFNVTEIPLDACAKWNANYTDVHHESGKFFKVEGIRVHTNFGNKHKWDQPIINQPEIGILGILTKIFGGVRYFLMQLKAEPGNVNKMQLSPTVQATRSNFMQVHKGKSTLFLEYFNGEKKARILIDQLQSEQGGRFLRKRNRNMIVEITDEITLPGNFFWLTLAELKNLMTMENIVNMDARSVLATIPLPATFGVPKYADEEIIRWYIDRKMAYDLAVEKIPITTIKNWSIKKGCIINDKNHYFSVIGVRVEAGNREISNWDQPMFKDTNEGLIGLIMMKFNNEEHYLFQTKVMPGNIDIIDLSPTVSVSHYHQYEFCNETVFGAPSFIDKFIDRHSAFLYKTKQSEEGGRFYHLQTQNMIVELFNDPDIPDNYIWLTRNQINKFMPYGMFNIEARSLIATLI